MKVLRYGHLRSAPVVVDAAYTHGVGTAYTPCSVVGLHAPLPRRLLRWLSSLSDDAQTRLLIVAVQDSRDAFSVDCKRKKPDPEVRERCRVRRLPFVYSPSGCAGQCGRLCCHSYCAQLEDSWYSHDVRESCRAKAIAICSQALVALQATAPPLDESFDFRHFVKLTVPGGFYWSDSSGTLVFIPVRAWGSHAENSARTGTRLCGGEVTTVRRRSGP